MSNYHFGQDLLDTYQSMSIVLQLAWLVAPLTFTAVIFALILQHLRLSGGEVEAFPVHEPNIYKLMNEDLSQRIGVQTLKPEKYLSPPQEPPA